MSVLIVPASASVGDAVSTSWMRYANAVSHTGYAVPEANGSVRAVGVPEDAWADDIICVTCRATDEGCGRGERMVGHARDMISVRHPNGV